MWETQRGDGKYYSFLEGTGVDFSRYSSDKLYQLPTTVDITINLSIMEKNTSEVGADHYFFTGDDKRRGGDANLATETSISKMFASTERTQNALDGLSNSVIFTDPSIPSNLAFNNVSTKPNLSLSDSGNVTARQFSTLNQPLTISSPTFDSKITTPTIPTPFG